MPKGTKPLFSFYLYAELFAQMKKQTNQVTKKKKKKKTTLTSCKVSRLLKKRRSRKWCGEAEKVRA